MKQELTSLGYCLTALIPDNSASWKATRTIFLNTPSMISSNREKLLRFIDEYSLEQAAADTESIILLPHIQDWSRVPVSLIPDLFQALRNQIQSPDPDDSRNVLWLWDSLICLAGIGDACAFTGNTAVRWPNHFAAVALLGGMPDHYDAGNEVTDHWYVSKPSHSWNVLCKDVPLSIWIAADHPEKAAEWFCRCADLEGGGESCTVEGISCHRWKNDDVEILVSSGKENLSVYLRAMMEFFDRSARWKSGPDGRSARVLSHRDFLRDPRFAHYEIRQDENIYHYVVRLPENYDPKQTYAVVISLPGNHESSRMFSTKNCWDRVCDQTREFLLVVPDRPYNCWLIDRDSHALTAIRRAVCQQYPVDPDRVYLTGFSNGSMATCWFGAMYPEQFAAVAPWNSPVPTCSNMLVDEKIELPMFGINGRADQKGPPEAHQPSEVLKNYIKANGGVPSPLQEDPSIPYVPDYVENYEALKDPECSRMHTYEYFCGHDHPRVCYTWIDDLPHGSIKGEAEITWKFFRHFSRNGRTVIYHE